MEIGPMHEKFALFIIFNYVACKIPEMIDELWQLSSSNKLIDTVENFVVFYFAFFLD